MKASDMKGTAYGVGVGPGDPELMTLKAARLIRENDIIAFAGRDVKGSAAYRIAATAVPEIRDKMLVPVHMPMVKDRRRMEEYLTTRDILPCWSRKDLEMWQDGCQRGRFFRQLLFPKLSEEPSP